jgi:hypothetical protein
MIFLYRSKSNNIGDAHCGWIQYFDFNGTHLMDMDEVEHNNITINDKCVIGGGVMAELPWYPNIHRQIENNPSNFMAVGVGTNTNSQPSCTTYWRHINPHYICPCPSCMSPMFDIVDADPIYDDIIYENPNIWILDMNLPKMKNIGNTMRNALMFLASGKTVHTSSYHGAYWASLLGRKVILYGDKLKFKNPVWKLPNWSLSLAREMVTETYDAIKSFGGKLCD